MRNISFLGLADQTTGLNGSFHVTDVACSESKVLFFCTIRDKKEKTDVMENEDFSELLKLQNVSKLKSYLKTHHLSESDEYQVMVTLGMDMEDEKEAEQIMCLYIRRHGLSLKAKQVLEALNFERALQVCKSYQAEQKDLLDLCEEKVSVHQKLQDGFSMLANDDVADRGIVHVFWGEAVSA